MLPRVGDACRSGAAMRCCRLTTHFASTSLPSRPATASPTVLHAHYYYLDPVRIHRRARSDAPARPAQEKTKASAQDAGATPRATMVEPPAPTLPFLPRPLGVKQRPSTIRTSWKSDMMDQDKRMAEREIIVKQATKGYFHDLNATRVHGGKTWIAPRVLIREDRALYFPDVEGSKLSDGQKVHTTKICYGKISVISMLSTRMSELHAENFVKHTNEAHLANPKYQYIQINLQENILKSFLVNLFTRSIRAQVPQQLHDTYLVSTQNMEQLRDPLGMTNKHIGYTYLVDDNIRVRWAGCGDAMGEEAEGLEKCVRQLLERLEAPAGTSTETHEKLRI